MKCGRRRLESSALPDTSADDLSHISYSSIDAIVSRKPLHSVHGAALHEDLRHVLSHGPRGVRSLDPA